VARRRPTSERVQANDIGLLGIVWPHVVQLRDLSFPQVNGRAHRDPLDRLLVAQAISERIPIVPRDPAFAAYSAVALW
jgi:PIN domain nuclease of toxin-antitoxin system